MGVLYVPPGLGNSCPGTSLAMVNLAWARLLPDGVRRMLSGNGFPALSVAEKVKVNTALSGLKATPVIVAVAVPVGGLCALPTSARRPPAWQTMQLSLESTPVPGGPVGP